MSVENNTTEDEALKLNAIALARHHKKTCAGMECDVSLYQLRRLLDRAGIVLSDEEKVYFF